MATVVVPVVTAAVPVATAVVPVATEVVATRVEVVTRAEVAKAARAVTAVPVATVASLATVVALPRADVSGQQHPDTWLTCYQTPVDRAVVTRTLALTVESKEVSSEMLSAGKGANWCFRSGWIWRPVLGEVGVPPVSSE